MPWCQLLEDYFDYLVILCFFDFSCLLKSCISVSAFEVAIISPQFSSVTQSCPTLCNPMDCSMPGFPVHHQLLEPVQTHVHWVGDAIQPSHPLLSPAPPAFNLSQHQSPFQGVSSSHQVAKVLEFQLQQQSFQWVFRVDFLYDWLVWSPCSPRDSQEFSPTPQFKSTISLVLSLLCCLALTSICDTGKTIALTIWTFVGKMISLLFNTLFRFVIAFLTRSNHLLISWLQSPSTVILEPKKRKSASTFPPFTCHEVIGPDAMILVLLILSFTPAFSLSFILIKRLFSSSSLSTIRVVSSTYQRLLIFLGTILIPACNLPNPTFLMMCSAYKLNKQGDNKQPCHTLFSILNPSVVPYKVLNVASWPAYWFLRSQVRWSGIPISLRVFHSLYVPHSQRL